MNGEPSFLTLGRRFRKLPRSRKPTKALLKPLERSGIRRDEEGDMQVTSTHSQTPVLLSRREQRNKKREWIMRSLSPQEYKFPKFPTIVLSPAPSPLPQHKTVRHCIPLTVTKAERGKPTLLEFYRFRPVLVEAENPWEKARNVSISLNASEDTFRSTAFYQTHIHKHRPLSIYLNLKHSLPQRKSDRIQLPKLPGIDRKLDEHLGKEMKTLRKIREDAIEAVMEKVKEEFELSQLSEQGLPMYAKGAFPEMWE